MWVKCVTRYEFVKSTSIAVAVPPAASLVVTVYSLPSLALFPHQDGHHPGPDETHNLGKSSGYAIDGIMHPRQLAQGRLDQVRGVDEGDENSSEKCRML